MEQIIESFHDLATASVVLAETMTSSVSFIVVTLLLYYIRDVSTSTTTMGDSLTTFPPTVITVRSIIPSPSSTAVCNSEIDMTSICPTCDESSITWGDAGRWTVFCGRLLTEATYYEDEQASTVEQCIDACIHSNTCTAPVIAPDGRCFLQVLGHDDQGRPEGLPIQEPGWAILLPAADAGGIADGTKITLPSVPATPTSSIFAEQTASPQHIAEFCQGGLMPSTMLCPECDDTFVEDDFGYPYQILCNSQWISSSAGQMLDFDLPRCMIQCENTPQCQGVTFSPAGCGLAVLDDSYIEGSSSDHTAFYLDPSIAPTAYPSSSTTAANSCQASSISCPSCANSYVKDDQEKIYHVLCDSSLYSESFYLVQQWLTPGGCMLECDNYTWCGGANFQPPGNCELAGGEDVFPQEYLGSTALIPVDLAYTPAPAQLSAFPTGEFTFLTD